MTTRTVSIRCDSAGEAVEILSTARRLRLQATYHPSGGATEKFYREPKHTVWIMGPDEEIEKLSDMIRKEIS